MFERTIFQHRTLDRFNDASQGFFCIILSCMTRTIPGPIHSFGIKPVSYSQTSLKDILTPSDRQFDDWLDEQLYILDTFVLFIYIRHLL